MVCEKNNDQTATQENTSVVCSACGKPLLLATGDFVGRKDECPLCRADLHVCLNCKHYDLQAYNECREPQADRVVEKNRSNFCDYFYLTGKRNSATAETKENMLKKLDDLFKR